MTHNAKFIPLKPNQVQAQLKIDESEKVFVFDIDETLYLCSPKIKKTRREHQIDFLKSHNFSEDEANKELERLCQVYGMEILGLEKEYNVSGRLRIFLAYPNPGSTLFIEEDKQLKSHLLKLKGRKVCLTNGNSEHAQDILIRLGVLDCFELIFHCDYEDENFLSKPDENVFKVVTTVLGTKPSQMHFFDDLDIHVEAARKLGWNASIVEKGVTVVDELKRFIEKDN